MSCTIHYYYVGIHESLGSGFSKRFEHGIGPGYSCINVQLSEIE